MPALVNFFGQSRFTSAVGGITGATVFFYYTGTTNLAPVYSDRAMTVPSPNPVLVAQGAIVPDIYLDPAINYRRSTVFSDGTVSDIDPLPSSDYNTIGKLSLTTSGNGASLVGNLGGGTVQDAIFIKGRASPVNGSKAKINWLRDDALAVLEDVAGLWSGPFVIDHGINKVFDASLGGANAPVTTLFVRAKNAGSSGDVVGAMLVAEVAASNKTVFGANIIAWSSNGATNYKLVGLEIDLQPQAGTTPSTAGGLYLNVFTTSVPGPAIYFEGIYGGKWGTGISVGNLSDNGSGIGPAAGNPRMGALLDSGVAQYQIAAIKLNNLHKQLFYGVSGNPAALYVDASNYLRIVNPSAGTIFRNNTDTTTLVFIDNGGSIDLQSGGSLKFTSGPVATTATAGLQTLPSNPEGFLVVTINSIQRKIPFYRT